MAELPESFRSVVFAVGLCHTVKIVLRDDKRFENAYTGTCDISIYNYNASCSLSGL